MLWLKPGGMVCTNGISDCAEADKNAHPVSVPADRLRQLLCASDVRIRSLIEYVAFPRTDAQQQAVEQVEAVRCTRLYDSLCQVD